jgi:hypothetical protein
MLEADLANTILTFALVFIDQALSSFALWKRITG